MPLTPLGAQLAAKALSTALYVHLLSDAENDRKAALAEDLLRQQMSAAEMRSTLMALEGRAASMPMPTTAADKTAAQKVAFGRAIGAAFKSLKGVARNTVKRPPTLKGVGTAALGVGAVYGASRGLSSAARRMARPVPTGRAWGAHQLAPKKRLTRFGYSGS